MSVSKSSLMLVLLFHLLSQASNVLFQSEFPLYRNAEIKFLSNHNSIMDSTLNWCSQIALHSPQLKTSKCYYMGELSRNPQFQNYVNWSLKNALPGIREAVFLKSRDSVVQKILKQNISDYLIFVEGENLPYKVILFTKGQIQPIVAIEVSSAEERLQVILKLFEGIAERKPALNERNLNQPSFYEFRDPLDWYFGIGTGSNTGFGNYSKTPFQSFNRSDDTLSTWNWMENRVSPIQILGGLSYARLLGLSLFLRYSEHQSRYDRADTTHIGIQNWSYHRYDLGLSPFIGKDIFHNKNSEISVRLILGFFYTFYSEDFKFNGSGLDKQKADLRVKFNHVKGASAGICLQYLFKEKWGITLQTHINGYGKSWNNQPLDDGSAAPDVPGASTVEWQNEITLRYHWRMWLD